MNYLFFKRFYKQLAQNKLYTLVNVFGFAVSIMFVILLGFYVQKELSFDQFHIKKDRIYRLTSESYSGYAPPVGKWLQDTYPEIESYTRVFSQQGIINDAQDNKFKIMYFLVDSAFFDIFSFKILEGDKKTFLTNRNSVVLTKSLAKKLFGKENPVGKQVTFNIRSQYLVSGIVEDLPENTHFQKCEAFFSFPALEDIWGSRGLMNDFGNCSFSLYLLARENSNLPARKLDIMDMFIKDFWLYKDGYAHELWFEPVTESYFSEKQGSGKTSNSKAFVNVLSAIVIFILIISLVNYINLTVAQSGLRNKEVATKRILGSNKLRLFFRFIAESTLVCFVACIAAVLLSLLVEPVFNNLLETNLHLNQKINLLNGLYLLSMIFVLGILAGIIPAFMITRLNPVEVIKGAFRAKTKLYYSKGLIAFQFTIVIILLICTWIIIRQTTFAKNYDTGFKKDNILCIQNTLSSDQKESFKEKMYQIPGVEKVVYVAGSPLDGGNNWSFRYNEVPLSFQVFVVDTGFFEMFGMKVTETGATYTQDAMWLNETAVKVTGLGPLTQRFEGFQNNPPVLGIVEDFNFRDLRQRVGPAMIYPMNANRYPWQILIKISDKGILNTVDKIKSAYNDFTNGLPLEMSFIDETMEMWYQREERTARITGYFTILAITISVLGILAMSLYYIQQKIKEIGIRKVTGANIGEIITMLGTDYILWVVIAFIIATPISWYAMTKWLETFAYKIKMDWWMFAVSGIATLLLALATVSFQSWRAARRNPVEALRYE